MKFNFYAPFNSLSFGQVSFNLAREIYRKNLDANIFPVGDHIDIAAFPLDESFRDWLIQKSQNRLKNYSHTSPTLSLWHINESYRQIGEKQHLMTFYETNAPTQEEINILRGQSSVIVSSSYTKEVFEDAGLENVHYVPLGFDEDVAKAEKYAGLNDEVIHFSLIGKFERRKNTGRILRIWVEKFGNNPKYQLSCLINNTFLDPATFERSVVESLGGRFSNINFLPTLQKNEQVNQLMKSIDVDLSGLSNAEGWNLPAFNATALGKWSCVTNFSSHKDWANSENSILVEPDGMQSCYDGIFFNEGQPFNQGEYAYISDSKIENAMDEAVKRSKTENVEGLKLQGVFTYQDTLEKLLFILKG
jgi:hypothetical protein